LPRKISQEISPAFKPGIRNEHIIYGATANISSCAPARRCFQAAEISAMADPLCNMAGMSELRRGNIDSDFSDFLQPDVMNLSFRKSLFLTCCRIAVFSDILYYNIILWRRKT